MDQHLNNSSSLSFLNVYAPPICSLKKLLLILRSSLAEIFILGDFNCHHPLWHRGGSIRIVISSDLLPLNDSDAFTPLHRFSVSRCPPDIFFAPSSLAPERCFRTGSGPIPDLLTALFSPLFRPNQWLPFYNF